MKRLLLSLAFAAVSLPAFAASLGYQQATSVSTSVASGLPSIPAHQVGSALISVESAGIRWRDDGTAPTASVGQPVASGQTFCYSNDVNSMQVIGQSGTPTINVTYYAGKGCAQ